MLNALAFIHIVDIVTICGVLGDTYRIRVIKMVNPRCLPAQGHLSSLAILQMLA